MKAEAETLRGLGQAEEDLARSQWDQQQREATGKAQIATDIQEKVQTLHKDFEGQLCF